MSAQIDENTKPTPSLVDAESLAAAFGKHVAEALRPVVANQQIQGQGQQKSKLQEKLDILLARENAEPERIAEIMEILEAAGQDMNARQQQDIYAHLQKERDARAIQSIQQAIQTYAAVDEDIADVAELIEKRVITDFNNKPECAGARERFQQGVIDLKTINDLVKVHVDRRAKLRGTDKGAGGAAGATKTEASSAPTNAGGDGGSPRKEDLVGGQRDLYDAHYSLLSRHGYKPEDAHKEAMAAAQKRKHK